MSGTPGILKSLFLFLQMPNHLRFPVFLRALRGRYSFLFELVRIKPSFRDQKNSADTNSPAIVYRSSGSFAIARRMAEEIRSGISGTSLRTSGAGSITCAISSAPALWCWKGSLPESNS